MAKKATARVTALPAPAATAPEKSTPAETAAAGLRAWTETNGVRRVRVGGFDLDGIFRGKLMSVDKLLSVAEGGFGFCDVVFGWDCADRLLDGLEATGWHTGYPDTAARLDPVTRRVLPWEPGTGLVLADFWEPATGAPLPICPRQTLKRVLARAAAHGCAVKAGFEYEFFFFRETPATLRAKAYRGLETLSPGMFGYSVLRASQHAPLVHQIFDELAGAGVEIEGMHTETGPGVYECALRYAGGLEAADRAALFKTAVKEIASRHGLTACFMAKWSADLPGCSGHVHVSLWDEASGHNRFRYGPGPGADLQRFVGGVVAGLPELTVLAAPTVNAYKRLVTNTWAPTTATWGVENRTTAVRVIPGGPASTRVEFRLPGADANPYLALAAVVGLGLLGWERNEAPPEPVTANAYAAPGAPPLPRTLGEAADRFVASERAAALLGEAFVKHYAATRRWEERQYQAAVTDWELARYFETA